MLMPEIPEPICRNIIDKMPIDQVEQEKIIQTELALIGVLNEDLARWLQKGVEQTEKICSSQDVFRVAFSWIFILKALETEIHIIPRISEDLISGSSEELRRVITEGFEEIETYLANVGREIEKENPHIFQGLHLIGSKCSDPETKILSFYYGSTVYKLIKAKRESKAFEEKWFPEPETKKPQ